MLYKKNKEDVLPDELFRNPTCEYRGWNARSVILRKWDLADFICIPEQEWERRI